MHLIVIALVTFLGAIAGTFGTTLFMPQQTFGAVTSVDRVNGDHIEPLIKTDYIKGRYFVASSTSEASVFPYASTTVLSGTRLCIGTDCRSVWPSSGSGGGLATSSPWNAGELAQVVDDETVTSIATSSLGLLTTNVAEGTNLYFTNARVQTYLDTVSKGFFFSTTSADYWGSQQGYATFGYPFPNDATTTVLKFTTGLSVGSSTPMANSLFTVGTSTYTGIHISSDTGKIGFGCINTSPALAVFDCGTNTNLNPNIKFLVQDASDARMGVAASDIGVFMKSSTGALGGGIFAYNYALGSARNLILNEFGGNVGVGTTSPWRTLSVYGASDLGTNALAGNFTATTSIASIFPYASTTALTASTLCLSTDCRTAWPTGLATSSPWTAGQLVRVQDNGTVISIATSSLNIAISDTTGTLLVPRGGTGAVTFSAGQLIYGAGTNALQSVATSSATLSSNAFSYSGTLGALVGGSSGTLSGLVERSFTIATSTAWTGTTTRALTQPTLASTINGIRCRTFTGYGSPTPGGTLNIQIGKYTASTTMLTASSTNNFNTFSANNSVAAGDSWYVSVGTPASSPTEINCTVRFTY